MAKSHLRVVAPTEVKRTVAPKRQKNAELRTREHFTSDEVEALMEAARGNRYGHRDATLILLTYRHGLRAAEVCDLRWDYVDFNGAVLHVRRVKNGTPSTHPIQGDELRALRRLHREAPLSPFVFVSKRGSPFTTAGSSRGAAARSWNESSYLTAPPADCGRRLLCLTLSQGRDCHKCDGTPEVVRLETATQLVVSAAEREFPRLRRRRTPRWQRRVAGTICRTSGEPSLHHLASRAQSHERSKRSGTPSCRPRRARP